MSTQPGGYVAPPPGAAPKSGNGCLKAFLIVGGIVLVLGIIGVVLLVVGVLSFGKAVQDTFGEAPASAYKLTVDTCTVDEFNDAQASGTITNRDGRQRSFRLDVTFSTVDGVVLDSNTFVTTPSLADGETGQWTATTFTEVPAGTQIKCRVDKVSFWGS